MYLINLNVSSTYVGLKNVFYIKIMKYDLYLVQLKIITVVY